MNTIVNVEKRKENEGKILKLKSFSAKSTLTFLFALILLLALSTASMPVNAPMLQYGPRSDLVILFYTSSDASYLALKIGDINIMDAVLKDAQLLDAQADPTTVLVKKTSPNLTESLHEMRMYKKCLPDLGQHSAMWCWVAALANSLIWYSQNQYPDLVSKEDLTIDPDSKTPGSPWYCPEVGAGNCEGYMKLLRRIAEAANKKFCEGILVPDEWDPLLDKLITNGVYKCQLEWKKLSGNDVTLDEYKKQLGKCEDVMLHLNNPRHFVTGASYGIGPREKFIDFSDPASNICNNDPKNKTYDEAEVTRNQPLTINHPGERTVIDMYYISPKPCKAHKAVKNVLGTVNDVQYGIDSMWTFFNAYQSDNPLQPIRYGVSRFPEMLNPIYSWQYQDWQVLERIYDPFVVQNPYDPYTLMPWLAQDWTVDIWVDPETGENKTKVTYWFRNDAEWIQPVTGIALEPLTTAGYEFNCWYYYQAPDAVGHETYNIHHIRPLSSHQVEIYYDTFAEWGPPETNFRLYAPAWKRAPLATLESKVFYEGINITTPGYVDLPYQTIGAPVEIISITAGGIPLTPYTDYEMCMGKIRIYKDFPPGPMPIQVTYWARGDAAGYTPGDLPWEEILIGTGPHYMTALDPLAYSIFDANRDYFLETPLLGELDWAWSWVDTTKPHSGYYTIGLPDLVTLAKAYGSTGTGVPSPNWFPGADLAAPCGTIGLTDLVTLAVNYGKKFGTPP
jgi:hypothetical protein